MKRLLLLLCGGIFFAHTSSAQCSFTINVNPYPTCFGQSTGFATAGVTGGVGPFTYQWLAPINQTGPSVGGLAAGTYQLAVYDSGSMCGDTVPFTITMMPMMQSAVSTTDASCGFCNGSAVATVMGGSAPYAFSWNNGVTSPMATGLCAGSYMLTITDATGCSVFETVTINSSPVITYSVTPNTATCGQCDGSFTINASGGTGSLQYSINAGVTYQASPTFNNVCAGAYLMVIEDANGCQTSTTITMPTTSGFTVGFDTLQTPGCGVCNGSLIALPSGGVQPYSYAWSGVGASVDSLATGICSGASVLITDGAGCVVNTGYSPVVNTIPGLTVTHSSSPESAAGANDGSIDVTVNTGSLTYLWSNGATTQDVFSLAAGNYTLYISDNAGNCSQFSFTVSLSPPQYGHISGSIYNDANANCTLDMGDNNLSTGYVVATPGNYYGYVNNSGSYFIWAPYGTYTVTHVPASGAGAAPSCVTSYNVTLNSGTPNSINNNFADTIVQAADAGIYIYSGGIVPGFNGMYGVYIWNSLPLAASGTVEFILPDTLTFVSASVTPSAISGDTLWFNYSNLGQGATQYIFITFSTPANPGLLGTSLTACATIDVNNIADYNLANNSACFSSLVTGSYDPNDKSVSPTGDGPTGKILLAEDTFTYLVRFQNTGNGPAVNIHVDDTISNLLDMSTFEMLSASHPYSIITKPGNVIVWQFDNINLPDSGSNEPGSHGYIQFKIKAKPNMAIGNVINNTADIYFDFNPPVITNTTVNTYSLPDFIEEISLGNSINVYPNPTSDVLTILNPVKTKGMITLTVVDVAGRTVKKTSFTGTQMSMDVKDLAPGMYVLQATDNGINYTTRFVRK